MTHLGRAVRSSNLDFTSLHFADTTWFEGFVKRSAISTPSIGCKARISFASPTDGEPCMHIPTHAQDKNEPVSIYKACMR